MDTRSVDRRLYRLGLMILARQSILCCASTGSKEVVEGEEKQMVEVTTPGRAAAPSVMQAEEKLLSRRKERRRSTRRTCESLVLEWQGKGKGGEGHATARGWGPAQPEARCGRAILASSKSGRSSRREGVTDLMGLDSVRGQKTIFKHFQFLIYYSSISKPIIINSVVYLIFVF